MEKFTSIDFEKHIRKRSGTSHLSTSQGAGHEQRTKQALLMRI
jgi:hypothetical protein